MSHSNMLLKAFGQRVRQLREAKGWTQEALAFHAGLHRTYVGSVERGERNISLKAIAALATALDVDLYELFIDMKDTHG